MKCMKHPKYKAIFQPKCDCAPCWKMWNKVRHKSFAERKTVWEN